MKKRPSFEIFGTEYGAQSSVHCSPVVDVVGMFHLLSSTSTTPVLAIVFPLVVEVRDDSPSPFPIMEVGSDSSSLPLVVEVRDDLSSVPPEIFKISSIDVHHQDKNEEVVIGEEERVVSKRGLEEEDDGVDFGRVKKSRITLLKKF
ncbi:hypothetical protein Adt_20688 [Abeliophyllum distichum]|uniref:Uncharacterized protein n=1 Tax=Abeliophyllum distichum TaxID=126358 RepID=A0ABD1SX97_9LAMI